MSTQMHGAPHAQLSRPAAPRSRTAVTGLPLAPRGAFARQPRWLRTYTLVLVGLDGVALLIGAMVGQLTRFDRMDGSIGGPPRSTGWSQRDPRKCGVTASGRRGKARANARSPFAFN